LLEINNLCTKVRETFQFASPTEVLRGVKVCVGSHSDSNLWQLHSHMAKPYFSAWRTCVTLAWQLPRSTHTYLGGLTSVRTDALARCAKFLQGLGKSPSREVPLMPTCIQGYLSFYIFIGLHYIFINPSERSEEGLY
jgi:hypothetical protein